MSTREERVEVAARLWSGFFRCPTTGRVLAALPGDNKALCSCGRSNPRVVWERTEQTATHILSFLERSTAAAFVAQEEARWES